MIREKKEGGNRISVLCHELLIVSPTFQRIIHVKSHLSFDPFRHFAPNFNQSNGKAQSSIFNLFSFYLALKQMNLLTYEEILSERGINVKEKTTEHPHHTTAEVAFRSDLGKGKCVWVNRFWKDYRYFVENHHVFISMIAAPDIHPFSRFERFLVFFSVTCVSAAFFVLCTSRLRANPKEPTTESEGWLIFGIQSAITIFMNFIMTHFATCSGVQDSSFSRRKKWESYGRVGLVIWVLIGVICGIWAVVFGFSEKLSISDWTNFFAAMTFSWVGDLFILFISFTIFWKWEKYRIELRFPFPSLFFSFFEISVGVFHGK